MAAPLRPWLGLDIGTRRIGVALSNALGIAQPLLTLERSRPRRDQRSILRLARRHGCAGIVVGNPLLLSGGHSRQTDRVHRFVEELQAIVAASSAGPDNAASADGLRLQIHLWDERLSTAEVHDTHAAARTPASRGAVDRAAAALILQGWLDAQSGAVTLLPPDR